MKVREARPGDIQVIADFQVRMAFETENLSLDKDVVTAGVKAVFSDPSKGRYFIVHKEGNILGTVLITPEWSDWRNGTIYWIQSLFVVPEHRRKGIFSLLFNHLKEIVQQDPNAKGIRLYVAKSNLIAKKAYEKSGMENDHYDLFEWMKVF